MKNRYYIEIKRGKVPSNIFQYPCEQINSDFLSKKQLSVVGNENIQKNKIVKMFVEHRCNIIEDSGLCSDLILLPSYIDANINTPKTYFAELFYYHDIIFRSLVENRVESKNIIVCLPYDSDECSTCYKTMADYATLSYTTGLSKRYSTRNIHIYSLLVRDDIDYKSLFDVLLYMMSSNSDHLIARPIKLG